MNTITISYPNKENSGSVFTKTSTFELFPKKEFVRGNSAWRNKLVFGDNLQVLRILCADPMIRGKVRLIYIDPPFSTNQIFRSGPGRTSTISFSNGDKKAYEDKMVGSDYLEFLRKRLVLLKELLAEDGALYLHIDEKMGHYVKILLDEIFGYQNFVNEIVRIKCNPKYFSRKGYGNIKDSIFFYAKTNKLLWNV